MKIVSTVFIVVFSLITALQGFATETVFTYSNGTKRSWGTGKAEAYNIAIALDKPELAGAEITKVEIQVLNIAGVSNYRVWIATNLPEDDSSADLYSSPAKPAGNNITITLPETVKIPETGCYVGYSFEVDDITTRTKIPVLVSPGAKEGGFFIKTSETHVEWEDRTAQFNVVATISVTVDGIKGFANIQLGAPYKDEISCLKSNQAYFPATLVNTGSEKVTEIGYTVSVNDETQTNRIEVTNLSEAYGDECTLEIPFTAPDTPGCFVTTLEVTEVNGRAVNTEPVSVPMRVLAFLAKSRPLVEELTGTWCSNCVRGIVGMQIMNERYGDDFIGVAYHNADAMQIADYPQLSTSYPMAFINRTISADPYNGERKFGFDEVWLPVTKEYPDAAISIDEAICSDSEIRINTTSTFALAGDAEYSVGYILVHNKMSGETNDWLQKNGYTGVHYYDNVEGLSEWVDKPVYVGDMEFNDVAVALSPYMGVENSLPKVITTESPYKHQYSFPLADVKNIKGESLVQNIEEMEVVAYILKADDSRFGQIVNAAKLKITDLTNSIATLPAEGEVLRIEYFDACGIRHISPVNGLNIVRKTYKDGRTATTKLLQ